MPTEEPMNAEEFEQMAVEVRDGDTKAPRIPTMRRIVAAYRAALERVDQLTADNAAAIEVLGKIAKPALGGKQQQWMAQEFLKQSHPGTALLDELSAERAGKRLYLSQLKELTTKLLQTMQLEEGEYGWEQALLKISEMRDELTRLRAEIKNLEDVRDMVCRNCDNLEAERDALKARVKWLESKPDSRLLLAAWLAQEPKENRQ